MLIINKLAIFAAATSLHNNLMEENTADKTFNIGDRIRVLRITQKRTLQELADGCGMSKSMISKIENNRTMPSVASLVKIAQSLGTTISNLMEQDGWAKAIATTRAEAESKLMRTEKGYSIFPYASEFHEKKMQGPALKIQRNRRRMESGGGLVAGRFRALVPPEERFEPRPLA